MPLPDHSALGHEWAILQDNHEQYEKSALSIKLGGVALLVASLALGLDLLTILLLLLVMWIQETVTRTSQARVGERILRIEQHIARGDAVPAHQLHTEWQAGRPKSGGLLAEYGKNMLRPTVAFPHAALIGVALLWFAAA